MPFALFPCKEFEIELEGSQTLRLLCYEKCCNKTRQSKEEGEITDKIMAKGQIKVRTNYGRSGSVSDVLAENYLCRMKIPVRTRVQVYGVAEMPISMLKGVILYLFCRFIILFWVLLE